MDDWESWKAKLMHQDIGRHTQDQLKLVRETLRSLQVPYLSFYPLTTSQEGYKGMGLQPIMIDRPYGRNRQVSSLSDCMCVCCISISNWVFLIMSLVDSIKPYGTLSSEPHHTKLWLVMDRSLELCSASPPYQKGNLAVKINKILHEFGHHLVVCNCIEGGGEEEETEETFK